MSVFAVIGGTGTIGRHIVATLQSSGAEVRVVSRSSTEYPVELTTGQGLDRALEGCDVVIDASNGPPWRPEAVLVQGGRRLAAAAAQQTVEHLVCVSIVGIDDMPNRYYRAKVAQEAVVRESAVPWTIVRSTQFDELVAGAFGALARWRLRPRAAARLQPIAAAEAAAAVAAVAQRPPEQRIITVAGPHVHELNELARLWHERHGGRMLALPVPLPPRTAARLRNGQLTCPAPDVRGQTSFAQWLETSI